MRSLGMAVLGVVLVAAAGCGPASYDRYIPSETTARESLELALAGWRDGKPPGRLRDSAPVIELVDMHRRPGQRLVSYDILGPAPGNGPRCLAVRLHLENPREEQRVRFVVLGNDPLWVVRYEDYEMMAHWECPPPPEEAAKTSKRGTR